MDRFEFEHPESSTIQPPLGFTFGPECGGLDLKAGDTIRMEAIRIDQHDMACGACAFIDARSEVPEAPRSRELPGRLGSGPEWFAEFYEFTTSTGCTGKYWIGIAPVGSQYLGPDAAQEIGSDHMLFRQIRADDATLCADLLGSSDEGVLECGDQWPVRVRISDGRQISRDLPLTSLSDGGIQFDAGQ